MKKRVLFWATFSLLMTLLFNPGCTEDPLPAFHKPNITASAENVSFGNVRLTCTVSNTLFKECGFYYGTRSDLSDKRTVRATVNGQSAEASLSGLGAGTYYFQAYADGGKSVATSGISSFAVKNVLEVDAGDFNLRYGEADIQITVETSLPLVVDLGGATWIKETRTKGLETYHKEFHIARNTGVEPRSAVIRISAQNGELSKSISVRQSGTPVPISDSNFKKYLLENFDTDKDGEIFYEEALKIERIAVNTVNIYSLQGIEYFNNLQTLICSGGWNATQNNHSGKITTLDVSNNLNLQALFCSMNELKDLDITRNTELIFFDCRSNELTSIDVSNNTKLTHLNCGLNQLTNINLDSNTALERIDCDCNQLKSLDISKCTALNTLDCQGNKLTTLDVSNNPALTGLLCSDNQLTSLDVSKNTALESLGCNWNQLTMLDVSKNAALSWLHCSSNQNLKYIWLETNQIIPDFNYDTNVATVHRTNGPVWIDLGLPSGLKWATCNIGASSPSDYGNYYAWGETSPKSKYDWSTYRYCNGTEYSLTKYNTDSSYGTVDNRTRLEMADDAARANWGDSWRMPTDVEWVELWYYCNWTWTTQGGRNGCKLTSKTNGNSIFLPAAGFREGSSLNAAGSYGYYWSSSLSSDLPSCAWNRHIYSDGLSRSRSAHYWGLTIRPVTE